MASESSRKASTVALRSTRTPPLKEATPEGCAFLDATALISPGSDHGVHLDALAHARFGEAMADCVKKLF